MRLDSLCLVWPRVLGNPLHDTRLITNHCGVMTFACTITQSKHLPLANRVSSSHCENEISHWLLNNIDLLLAECEIRTASYGQVFFFPFKAQARSARAMKTRKEKTRIHDLPYGPTKRS